MLSLGVIGASSLFMSCAKTKLVKQAPIDNNFSNRASVQVFDATLGSAKNYVYVDGSPVTGIVFAYSNTFPSTPSDFSVTAGTRQFLIKDTSTITAQAPMSFAEFFQSPNNYTIFMYDTSTAAKHKTVQNNILIPSDTTSRIRFANFAYSPTPIPAFDVYSADLQTNVFTNVNTTDVTNYIPYLSNRNDTLYLRLTGTTTNILNRTNLTGGTAPIQIIVNPIRLRNYTLVLRGGWRTDLTTAATFRTFSFFSNN